MKRICTIMLGGFLAAICLSNAMAQQIDTRTRTLPQAGQSQGNGQYIRPARYVCLIKPPQSEKNVGLYSCPAAPGRVGETCRCPNTVGSGRLSQY